MGALHHAARSGSVEAAFLGLKSGEDPNGLDERGLSPLFAAVESRSREVADFLLDYGATVDVVANGRTPLHAAVETNDPDMVALLVARAAPLETRLAESGETPLLLAVEMFMRSEPEQTSRIVECLLKAGANASARRDDGMAILHWAALWAPPHTVDALLRARADADVATEAGATPLHVAAASNSPDRSAVVSLLLASEANLRALDKQGHTPEDVARENGHEEIASQLASALEEVRRLEKLETERVERAYQIGELSPDDLDIQGVANGDSDA